MLIFDFKTIRNSVYNRTLEVNNINNKFDKDSATSDH